MRVETFLDSGRLTDFEFRVKLEDGHDIPEQKFHVHKLFLAMRNEVFEAMFFGGLAEKSEAIVTDVHPRGFDLLLRYLYSGKLKMESIDDARHARFAARKYMVEELVDACTYYIAKRLKADRLCSFLDYYYTQSRETEMDAVVDFLLTSWSAPAVLDSPEFNDALEETVLYIVDKIRNVSEDALIKAVYGWAQQQSAKSLQSDNPCEVKALMRAFFPKLRFLTLTADQFLDGPGSWGVLDDADKVAILRNIERKGYPPLPKGFCRVTDNRFSLQSERIGAYT
ncbi:hypothetical protein MTO96_041160 [Rhipicephalus appendiculatus]